MTIRGIKKIEVQEGHSSGVCDFCHTKGQTYKLVSQHRKYRFLSVCKPCMDKIRRGFRKRYRWGVLSVVYILLISQHFYLLKLNYVPLDS